MRIRIGATIILAGIAATVTAEEPIPASISTFLDDQTAVLAHVRLDRLDFSKLDAKEPNGLALRWLGGRTAPMVDRLRKAGARDLYLFATLQDRPQGLIPGASVLVPIVEGVDAGAIGEILCGAEGTNGEKTWKTCATIRGVVFAGDDAALERAKGIQPVARPDLAAALGEAGDSAVAVAIAPPPLARRIVEELAPTLPAEFGSGPSTVLSRGLSWASISVRPDQDPALRLTVKAADDSAAKALREVGARIVAAMKGSPEINSFVPDFADQIARLAPRSDGDRIVIELNRESASAWARAIVDPFLDRFARAESVTKLKTLGLAMHNYAATHKTFPPAYSVDAAGKPLLSWRVLILPFIDENELYKEFHLDEPWDSPHNKALIARMPDVYATRDPRGDRPSPGSTVYQTPRSPDSTFPGADGVEIKAIKDGTSNTIMILETPTGRAVSWTSPDDWNVPAEIDPKAVLSHHAGGSYATMADGSVRFFRDSIKPETLKALLTRAGGEALDPNEL